MAVKPRSRRRQNVTLQGLLNRYYSSVLTPKQQRKQARRETNLALGQSMRELRTTYQQEYERMMRSQYAMGQYGDLLRGYGAPGSSESEAIRQAYGRAAGLSEAEAKGFISPTIRQQSADVMQAQSAAENLAGYTGQVGAITPGSPQGAQSPEANAQVLNYLAGLPRGTFEAQAESAARGVGRAGAEAAGNFYTRLAQQGQEIRELRDKYLMGVQDLKAKRPGLVQEALSALQESGRGDISTIINAMYLQNTMAGTQAELTGKYKGKLTPAERQRRTENALAQTAAAATAERNAISRMNARTSRMRANISQQKVLMDQYGTQGDMVKLENSFRSNAEKWVRNMLAIDKKKGRPLNAPPSRQTLINAIYRIYGASLVGKYGLTKQQVALWAAQVVSAFPQKYWDPKTYQAKAGTKGTGKTPSAADILGG